MVGTGVGHPGQSPFHDAPASSHYSGGRQGAQLGAETSLPDGPVSSCCFLPNRWTFLQGYQCGDESVTWVLPVYLFLLNTKYMNRVF